MDLNCDNMNKTMVSDAEAGTRSRGTSIREANALVPSPRPTKHRVNLGHFVSKTNIWNLIYTHTNTYTYPQ